MCASVFKMPREKILCALPLTKIGNLPTYHYDLNQLQAKDSVQLLRDFQGWMQPQGQPVRECDHGN
jgi:hypothetical protein